MTTATAATAAASPHTTADRVAQAVSGLITPLQRDYLADRPHAVAALARLRRGAGKEFAQVPDLWGLIDTGALHDVSEDGRPLSERELVQAEDAVHVALTLWALHQQSRRTGMHQPDQRMNRTALGASVRRLMPENEIAEPVRKRFVRAGNAPTRTALAERLRDIVLLLRGAELPLDYAQLAAHLYRWQRPGGRDAVRRAWGRSFHAHYAKTTEPTGDGTGATDTDTADTTDKDAS